MTDRFEGRTALVTGATRGIGFGIAAELVARGANVCITARKEPELDAAVAKLGDRAIAVRGSADDAGHQRDAVAKTIERFGSLDVLVNNAGINPHFGPLVDADLGAVRKIFEVNVTGALAWTQQAWNAWMREHTGVVLNVASIGGIRNAPFIGAYNVSKAALIHLTQQLAMEMGPQVRVNAIAPAVVKTDFAKALYEGREDQVAGMYPLRRLGTIDDTAKLAAFLCSDDASWITGETVAIDGGVRWTTGVAG